MQNSEEINITPLKEEGNIPEEAVKEIYDQVFKLRLEQKCQDALNILNPLIEAHPTQSIFKVMRADVYKTLYKEKDVIAELKALIEQEPKNVYALTVLADIYKFQKEYTQAMALLERAFQRDPENSYALTVRGDILLRIGKLDEALSDLTRALKVDPANPLIHYVMALYYSEKLISNKEQAIQHLDTALEVAPNYLNALKARVTLDQDLDHFYRLIDLDPNLSPKNVLAIIEKGAYLSGRCQYSLAIDWFTLLLDKVNPNLIKDHIIVPLYNRAITYKNRAQHDFLLLKGLNPYSLMPGTYIESGPCKTDLDKAGADLKQMLEKHPGNKLTPLIKVIQADIHKLLGENVQALACLEEYLELIGSDVHRDAASLLIRGEIKLQTDYADAINDFEEAVQLAINQFEKIKNDCTLLMRLANVCITLASHFEGTEEDDFCFYIQQAFIFYQAVSREAPHILPLSTLTVLSIFDSNITVDSDFFEAHQEELEHCFFFESVLDAWRERKEEEKSQSFSM